MPTVCAERDPWLTKYLHERLLAAGVESENASVVAGEMSAEISAAFATLGRLLLAEQQERDRTELAHLEATQGN
jgi:hypothetical protein